MRCAGPCRGTRTGQKGPEERGDATPAPSPAHERERAMPRTIKDQTVEQLGGPRQRPGAATP
ncbi:hypothetical protein GCM10019016_088230 [Streptomyces prasinosporus]|uniref:Uncharacterized protein n=1 Tax=Streptomyces prasinosporus TaxID=68256 RepID=A0ABP6U5Z0_9ACTN